MFKQTMFSPFEHDFLIITNLLMCGFNITLIQEFIRVDRVIILLFDMIKIGNFIFLFLSFLTLC